MVSFLTVSQKMAICQGGLVMRRYKKFILLLFIACILSGCATAQLAKGPDINNLKQYTGASQVAVAMTEDVRPSTNAGSIGATSIDVPKDANNMVYNYLVSCLNENLGINIKEAGRVSQQDIAQVGAERLVVSDISSIKIYSFDAIMQPVQTEVLLNVAVLNKQGTAIYRQSYVGKYEERIGISIVSSKTGQLVESAIKNLMTQISGDDNLKKALSQ